MFNNKYIKISPKPIEKTYIYKKDKKAPKLVDWTTSKIWAFTLTQDQKDLIRIALQQTQGDSEFAIYNNILNGHVSILINNKELLKWVE